MTQLKLRINVTARDIATACEARKKGKGYTASIDCPIARAICRHGARVSVGAVTVGIDQASLQLPARATDFIRHFDNRRWSHQVKPFRFTIIQEVPA